MIKRCILFLCLIFTSFSGFSQKAVLGLKAGLNISSLSNSRYGNVSPRKASHFGITGSFKLSNRLVLQPELVYSDQGLVTNLGPEHSTIKLHYLTLPIITNIYISKKFHFDFGAQFGLLLGSRLKGVNGFTHDHNGITYSYIDQSMKHAFKPKDLSICVGFGLDLTKKINVGARINYGLNNVEKYSDPLSVQYREKYGQVCNRVFQLSAGYKFGKSSQE